MEELRNDHFDDCYFSIESGYSESRYVFIDGNNLGEKLEGVLNIGETGFGTGLNLLVLEDFLELSDIGELSVNFTSVEKYPLDTESVIQALGNLEEVKNDSLSRHNELYKEVFKSIKKGWNSHSFRREWGVLNINIFIGDVLDSFKSYPFINNCWFLDGHSPDKNPDMWSREVFNAIANNSVKGTTLATFTAAGVVKTGLREAGFFVKRRKGWGRKRHMIISCY